MSRPLAFFVFIPTALAMAFGIHYYFWARLIRDTALPPPWRAVATGALLVLGPSLPLALFLGRLLPREVARLVVWPAYVWLGLVLLLLLSVVGADLVRLGVHLWQRFGGGEPFDPARRLLFLRALGGAAAATAASLAATAVRSAMRTAEVKHLEVPLARLPRALDGTRVVQLTDLHLGPTLGRAWMEEIVQRTNALEPDLIAITGDLVDGPVAALREAVAPLASLRARYGVFFVTGNHEYYAGADAWLRELGRLGVRVLRNEHVTVGEGEHRLHVAGVDDFHSRGMAPGHGPDLPRALAGRDGDHPILLLAHQPKAVHEAAQHGVDLQLSGHTHGGQIWPWKYMVYLQQPYVEGLIKEGPTLLYVSRGTGYWGPPMRLGADAEITHIVLRSVA